MPKLTKRLIDATPCPKKGQSFLRDDELHGFALRLTTGAKTFILEKRIKGRVRRMTIGTYGPLTLIEARMMAIRLLARIFDGENPAQDEKEARRGLTFKDLTRMYIERHGPRKKSIKNDESLINNHLTKWNNWKLTSISRGEVARVHGKVGETAPYSANRLVALIRKMFNLADVWGFYEGDNPATRIELFQEEKRERFIKKSEFPALIEALGEEPNPFIRVAFITCLFTGARKTEVLSMKWSDLDFEECTWRIPDTKAGHSHTLPIVKAVVSRLQELPRYQDNPHVFPGQRKGSHLVNISKAWKRVKERAELNDVRIHDLRRTLASWMAGSGTSLPIIGKVLNHSQPSTTAIYSRLQVEAIRGPLEDNAKRMVSIGGELPLMEVEK